MIYIATEDGIQFIPGALLPDVVDTLEGIAAGLPAAAPFVYYTTDDVLTAIFITLVAV